MSEQEYRDHIESVVSLTGRYNGEQHSLVKSRDGFLIQCIDNKYTCKFDTLDTAIETFVLVEPIEE